MSFDDLNRKQVWIYLVAILFGLGAGSAVPALSPVAEGILWPTLALLLYATFTQVPLTHLREAFRDTRFTAAVLIGNFVAVPVCVWGIVAFFPVDDPAVRLGILIVLLVPCTDWFITFTHLGGGDTGRAIAITPVNLLVQLVLLPAYLLLFMGTSFVEILAADRIVTVFVALIVLPLVAAFLTERWTSGEAGRTVTIERLGRLPIPLLAVVVFLIASSQVGVVADALPVLAQVAGVFVVYLVVAAVIGLVLARAWRLPTRASRALIFSLGTRNSFVVLPLALALAAPWQTAVVVIVLQSLVELFGMVAYLWIVPRLVPAPAEAVEPAPRFTPGGR